MKRKQRDEILANILKDAVENAISGIPVDYIVEEVIEVLESENFPINELKGANEDFMEELDCKVYSTFEAAFENHLNDYLIRDLGHDLAEIIFEELEYILEENSVEWRNDKIQAWINSRKNTAK